MIWILLQQLWSYYGLFSVCLPANCIDITNNLHSRNKFKTYHKVTYYRLWYLQWNMYFTDNANKHNNWQLKDKTVVLIKVSQCLFISIQSKTNCMANKYQWSWNRVRSADTAHICHMMSGKHGSMGSSIKYVRTEGEGSSRPMHTHCVHGRRGSGCCVRTHFFKYSSKVITFNKLYITVEYILHKKMIAWENDLSILYYVHYVKYTSDQIAYMRKGGGGVKATAYALRTRGGGQKLAKFCVRTLWMAPLWLYTWLSNLESDTLMVFNMLIIYEAMIGKQTDGSATQLNPKERGSLQQSCTSGLEMLCRTRALIRGSNSCLN